MKSLELNWIRKKCDKSLVMPEVMFHELDYSGMYIDPQDCEYYDMDGHPVHAGRGLIIVDPEYPEDTEGIIAHEWRHHWQFFNGFEYDGLTWEDGLGGDDYDIQLRKYFTNSQAEMDALRFQYKHSFVYDSWEELLYPHLKLCR